MVGEDIALTDLQYIVILYDNHGVSAAMTTEGKVFIIVMPFTKETAAKAYVRDIKNLINKDGLLFKRIQ